MLVASRILALGVGAFMLYFVLGGLLAYPAFRIPDLTLGALLIIAALCPPRIAPLALIAANMFALGVYSVAVFNQIELGVKINPPLIAVIAAVIASLVFAAFSKGQRGI